MNFLKTDTDELRTQILHKSLYFADVTEKENTQLELIELDTFDMQNITESVNKSSTLLSFDKPLILEVLDVMNKNKNTIGLDQQSHIGLYFNGKPLLRIKINKEVPTQILHISLQKYRTLKTEYMVDKKLNRMTTVGIGGLLFLSSLIVGLSFVKKN
jgi:hypothetical protein